MANIKKPDLNIFAEFTILECQIGAAVEFQGDSGDAIIAARQLNTDDPAKVPLAKFLETFQENLEALIPGAEIPLPTLPKPISDCMEAYSVVMKEAMFRFETKDKEVTGEFALWIKIELNEGADSDKDLSSKPPFSLIKLNELHLKVWNTDHPAILKEMKGQGLQGLLEPPPPSDEQ